MQKRHKECLALIQSESVNISDPDLLCDLYVHKAICHHSLGEALLRKEALQPAFSRPVSSDVLKQVVGEGREILSFLFIYFSSFNLQSKRINS